MYQMMISVMMSSSGFGYLWWFYYPGPAHQLLSLELEFTQLVHVGVADESY